MAEAHTKICSGCDSVSNASQSERSERAGSERTEAKPPLFSKDGAPPNTAVLCGTEAAGSQPSSTRSPSTCEMAVAAVIGSSKVQFRCCSFHAGILRQSSGTALARISRQLLNTAEPMSSKEAAMRARKANPRPGGGRELGNRVSAGMRVFLAGRILILPSLGAVLPQSGYHLPRSLVSVRTRVTPFLKSVLNESSFLRRGAAPLSEASSADHHGRSPALTNGLRASSV